MVLAEDRPNFIYAMTAAPAGAPTWKQVLLEGKVDLSLARQAAALAALFLDVPQQLPNLTQRFSTKDRFEQLRVSPYYRHTLHRHPDLAAPIERAIGQALTSTRGLTHGDWSPKNFLIYPDPATQAPRLFSIDYEVTHIGDPAFDCAFLLNHFLLKGWKRPSAQPLYKALALEYVQTVVELTSAGWLEGAALVHLGCLHLARVDGKSPVEYLSPVQQSQVRRFARDLIQNAASTVEEVFERQAESFHE
jgi:5-methylthioribose kinase